MTPQTTLYQGNKIRLYLSSAVLFAGMALSLLIFSPLVLVCVVFPFSVRYRISRLWAQSVLWLTKICCGLDYEIEGLEYFESVDTAIVLSKHQSAWETIAFRYILPMHTVLLKRSLMWLPLWGWAMAVLKPIAIDRKNQQAALRMLLERRAVLAQQSDFPVIPIALQPIQS